MATSPRPALRLDPQVVWDDSTKQFLVFAGVADVRGLYQFATTRGDVLRFMPCTCGCAQLGHTSNRSCYVEAESDASVTYTSHAAT